MPEIARFFGIVVQMFFDDHNPPHFHAEFHGAKALVDFRGNVIKGDLKSKTALRLLRDWIDLHYDELVANWEQAQSGNSLNKIAPLD